MRIQLCSRSLLLTGELREYARRRVWFALGRFAPRIRGVAVRLSDINGPRGGCDKVCRVTVETEAQPPISIEERQQTVFAAIALAAERAGRAAARRFERRREPAMAGARTGGEA